MSVPPLQLLDLKSQRVLMRVDFNVPLDTQGKITDATRIEQALPSIRYVLNQGGKLILISHLGRPKGPDPKLSLKPCAEKLSTLLGQEVKFAPDCVGDTVQPLVMSMEPGDINLLENLRFHLAEEHPDQDPEFAKALAKLGGVYVNDAFGTAHRKHSSTYVVPSLFPGKVAAGFLMEKEINYLSTLATNPKRPFYAILGGAKISSKLGVLQALLDKVDGLFVGGAMAFTFLKAAGALIGKSLVDEELIGVSRAIMQQCQDKAVKFYLPKDVIITQSVDDVSSIRTVEMKDGIPEEWMGVDIGPQTLTEWQEALASASTIFWNGPMGVFEMEAFAVGTKGIAQILGNLDVIASVGGGDSVAAINQCGLSKNFTHISTGGGASIEFIQHGNLPGIDILR